MEASRHVIRAYAADGDELRLNPDDDSPDYLTAAAILAAAILAVELRHYAAQARRYTGSAGPLERISR